MSSYVLESFGKSVYEKIEPFTRQDKSNNFALAHFVAACSRLLQEIDTLAGEVDGLRPWEQLFRADLIPAKGLGWLAQFVGVTLDSGAPEAISRARILSTDGFWRGTPDAMIGAAIPYLTGAKTVIFRERDPAASPSNPAYGLTVITRTAQTPDPAKVLAALMSQKPAGIILNYVVLAGQDYTLLYNAGATTYQSVFTTYATYQGVLNAVPGT